jgi:hypothetical protein
LLKIEEHKFREVQLMKTQWTQILKAMVICRRVHSKFVEQRTLIHTAEYRNGIKNLIKRRMKTYFQRKGPKAVELNIK